MEDEGELFDGRWFGMPAQETGLQFADKIAPTAGT